MANKESSPPSVRSRFFLDSPFPGAEDTVSTANNNDVPSPAPFSNPTIESIRSTTRHDIRSPYEIINGSQDEVIPPPDLHPSHMPPPMPAPIIPKVVSFEKALTELPLSVKIGLARLSRVKENSEAFHRLLQKLIKENPLLVRLLPAFLDSRVINLPENFTNRVKISRTTTINGTLKKEEPVKWVIINCDDYAFATAFPLLDVIQSDQLDSPNRRPIPIQLRIIFLSNNFEEPALSGIIDQYHDMD